MKKFILAAAAVALIGSAAAQSFTPSHPLSHIHPVDVDFNMSGQEIYNASELSIKDGLTLSGRTIYEPDADGAAPILEWRESNESLEIQSDLDLNDNNIQKYFEDGTCQSGYLVDGINPNGTYKCTSINETASNVFVEVAGDEMTGDLNFSDADINDVRNITNFFEDNCESDEVIRRVYEDGTYECVDPDENETFAQNLSEVLDVGNAASDDNISMSQQVIKDIGTGRSNFTAEGGLSLQGNLDVNLNDVEDIENLYRDDSQTNFFEDACGEFRAVKGIYPNGTYKCTEEILEEETEYLNETLDAGNSAGDNNILMNGNNVVLEGGYLTNDTDDDGIRVADSGRAGVNTLPSSDRSLNVDESAGFGDSVEIASAEQGTNNTLDFIGNEDALITGSESFTGNSNSIILDNPDQQPIIFETNGKERFRVAGDGEQISFDDLNMTEQNIQSIRALQDGGGTDSLVLDESNNLRIPNGNLDLDDNQINDTSRLKNDGALTIEADSQNANSGDLTLQTGGSDRLVALNDGEIRVPNGNINLSENQLEEVQRINLENGASTAFIEENSGDQLRINSQGDILRLQDSSSSEISAESNIRMNENDLEQVGEIIINDNDSSGSDFVVRENSNGEFVLERGGTQRIQVDQNVSIPTDDLDLNSNDIIDISNLYEDDSSTNFFDAACGEFRALKGIHPNGSFICTEEILEEETEGLNETLDAGNFAGPRDIYMNGSEIREIGTGRTNFTDSGGLEIAGDVSLNDNTLDEVSELNTMEGTNLAVGAAQTDFEDNEINNVSKIGVKTDTPDENLDVDGSANISSGGTSMNVKDNGNVVVTLG